MCVCMWCVCTCVVCVVGTVKGKDVDRKSIKGVVKK